MIEVEVNKEEEKKNVKQFKVEFYFPDAVTELYCYNLMCVYANQAVLSDYTFYYPLLVSNTEDKEIFELFLHMFNNVVYSQEHLNKFIDCIKINGGTLRSSFKNFTAPIIASFLADFFVHIWKQTNEFDNIQYNYYDWEAKAREPKKFLDLLSVMKNENRGYAERLLKSGQINQVVYDAYINNLNKKQ